MSTKAADSLQSPDASQPEPSRFVPEAVFACELEADELVVTYANLPLCEVLGIEAARDAIGRRLFDLFDARLATGARADVEEAIAAGREVWVQLDDVEQPPLRLAIKPASVPGAWVGSVRRVDAAAEAAVSIKSAFLQSEAPASAPEREPTDSDAEPVPSQADREAALARTFDAAGITWLEQDLATGALTLAGRKLHEPDADTASRGGGLERFLHPADAARRRAAFEALTAGRAEELYCAYRIRDAAGHWVWTLEVGHLAGAESPSAKYSAMLQPMLDAGSIELDGIEQELAGVTLMLRKLELDAAAAEPRLDARLASVRRMVEQCLATTTRHEPRPSASLGPGAEGGEEARPGSDAGHRGCN